MFDFNLRLLSEMLNVGPWNRLPLTVQWLRPEIKFAEFPPEKKPPVHMTIVKGTVEVFKASKKQATASATDLEDNLICAVCIEDARLVDQVHCPSVKCGAVAHLLCLAEHFGRADMQLLLPVEGRCPVCDCSLLWGDIVRNRKTRLQRLGCLQQEEVDEETNGEDEDDNL
jgi:structure-specific endonuclease subunit SLX1